MKQEKKRQNNKKVLIGALATMIVIDKMFGKDFADELARQISPLGYEDRLTFWNLINVKINPNKDTHIIYGSKDHCPDMIKLVDDVYQVLLKRYKRINTKNKNIVLRDVS